MAQFARPASDITLNSWTDNGGGTTNIFQAIDEVTQSDADFVTQSNNNINDFYEFGLSTISTPSAGTVTIRYSYRKNAAGGNSRNFQAFLYEGTTLRSSGTLHSNISETFTSGSWAPSAGEVASITDWSNLRLRFEASGTTGGPGGNRRAVQSSWGELEAPDATVSYTLTADPGSFILTGRAAELRAGRGVVGGEGVFSLTPNPATISKGVALSADIGVFSLSGYDVLLPLGRTLQSDVGNFTLVGYSTNLLAHRKLVANNAVFTLSGVDADLVFGRVLSAVAGGFTLDGFNTGLIAARTLPSQEGQFIVTSYDADIFGGLTLSAQNGVFALNGTDAGFIVGRALVSQEGVFSLSGVDAGISTQRSLLADDGVFLLTGEDADLIYTFGSTYTLSATGQSYTVGGQDVTFQYDRVLVLSGGVFLYTPYSSSIFKGIVFKPPKSIITPLVVGAGRVQTTVIKKSSVSANL